MMFLLGYGEVSVDTDVGKMFAVAFALVGIPLMFITAADIGKFLSETLMRFVRNWNRMMKWIKQICCRRKYGRRKSMQSNGSAGGVGGDDDDGNEVFGIDGTEEKLWFPIGKYNDQMNVTLPSFCFRRLCRLYLFVLFDGRRNVHQLGIALVIHTRLSFWF